MGTDVVVDYNDNERPVHQVTLSAYCIERTEVTVAAYKRSRQGTNSVRNMHYYRAGQSVNLLIDRIFIHFVDGTSNGPFLRWCRQC
jgi:formylglycine-generating enzyme required for sulfatase activity